MLKFALGDLAYCLFRPAVWLIDATWGTDLHSCEVCAARRARWNALPYSRTLAVAGLTIMAAAATWWIAR